MLDVVSIIFFRKPRNLIKWVSVVSSNLFWSSSGQRHCSSRNFCAIFFCIRRTLNSKIKTCLKIDYRRVSHFTPLAWFLWNNSDSFYISSLTHNTARRRMLLWFCASSNSFIKFQMPKRDCVVVRWKYLCVGNICPLKDKMCIMDVFLEILHMNREMCEVIHIKLMKKYSSLMIKIDCSTDIVPILSLWHD